MIVVPEKTATVHTPCNNCSQKCFYISHFGIHLLLGKVQSVAKASSFLLQVLCDLSDNDLMVVLGLIFGFFFNSKRSTWLILAFAPKKS